MGKVVGSPVSQMRQFKTLVCYRQCLLNSRIPALPDSKPTPWIEQALPVTNQRLNCSFQDSGLLLLAQNLRFCF